MKNSKLILLMIFAAMFFVFCAENTNVIAEELNNGDTLTDEDENSTDMAMSENNNQMETEQTKSDNEPLTCEGSCDREFLDYCIDDNVLCTCNDKNQKEKLNCLEGAKECPWITTPCQYYDIEGYDVCMNQECPCETDDDCKLLTPSKDRCVADSNGFKECVSQCEISTCTDTLGCLDLGRSDGFGICVSEQEKPSETCDASNPVCGDQSNKLCSNVCGALEQGLCFEKCNAIPNSCENGEICAPFHSPEDNTVLYGICQDIGAKCPANSK